MGDISKAHQLKCCQNVLQRNGG